jgi:hypothetical protein
MTIERRSLVFLAILWTFLCAVVAPATAQIQVTATSPSAAPQGTINLNITVSGNGFKRGAKAQWFVSGTTNPGGVTVNSTTVKGSSQLTANITVALDANIANFDVVVTNTDGRTGKGTDLFAVTVKGTPIGCTTSGTPSGFSLATVLNPVQSNGAASITTLILGNAIRVRPLDLNRDGVVDTLVAFVTSGSQNGSVPGTYIFFLDPATGQPQANNPITGAAWKNPLQVLSGVQSRHAAAGDVNGDGVPDFALASPAGGVAYLFVGAVSGSPSYTPSYTAYKISPPPGAPSTWARTVALGDLDGDGRDEIAVAAVPGSKQAAVPAVYLFKYTGSGVSLWKKIQDPTGSQTSDFAGGIYGGAVAIGNITGGAGNDLAVGADGAGLVYVFPYPASQSNYFTLSGPGVGGFGEGVAIADVNLDSFPDLVVNAGGQKSGQTFIFAGIVRAGESYTNQLLPAPGLGNNWALPDFAVGNLESVGGVAVGTPNASNSNGCSLSVGALQLFTSPYASSQQPNYVFEPPSLTDTRSSPEYGYSVGFVSGFPIMLIGEHYRDVGTTSMAGQVYVYKKN